MTLPLQESAVYSELGAMYTMSSLNPIQSQLKQPSGTLSAKTIAVSGKII